MLLQRFVVILPVFDWQEEVIDRSEPSITQLCDILIHCGHRWIICVPELLCIAWRFRRQPYNLGDCNVST